MNNDQINQLADTVADRLATSDKLADAVAARLNGQLSSINDRLGKVAGRLGKVEGRLGTLEGIASANASKIADLHGWMGTLNGRITDLEEDR